MKTNQCLRKTRTGMPVPFFKKTLVWVIACAFASVPSIHSDEIINDAQTATPPGGESSEWDFTDERVVIGSGPDATGSLTVPAGTEVLVQILDLGADAASATGNLEVTGSGAVVRSSVDQNPTGDSLFNIGLDGTGEALVTDGGLVESRTTLLGLNPDSEGTITVTGTGSAWNSLGGGAVHVGSQGTGTLNVLDGGTVDNFSNFFVGNSSVEDGGGNVIGGGLGEVLVSGGSSLSGTASSRIANNPGTQGSVTVSGAQSSWSVGSFLHVGTEGNGTLVVEDGGTAETGSSLHIGRTSGDGNGHVHVTGEGSLVESGSFFYVGHDSTGTLLADEGATVRTGSDFRIGRGSGTGVATITGEDTSVEVNLFVHVGSEGDGTLILNDGATLTTGIDSTNAALTVGVDAGSTGHLEVSGVGTLLDVGSFLYVGRSGDGTMLVDQGATVAADGTFRVGFEPGGTGEVTITGEGTSVTSSSFVQIGGDGEGVMNVIDGGRFENTGSTFTVGRMEGSTGALNVSGGQVQSSSHFYSGREGDGTTNVTNGGEVTTGGNLFIGESSTATGTVTVDGEDSRVEAGAFVLVGSTSPQAVDPEDPAQGVFFDPTGGSAALSVTDGGAVVAQEGVVVRGDNSIFIDGGTISTTGLFDVGEDSSIEFFLGSPDFGGISADSIRFEDGATLNLELGYTPEFEEVFLLMENTGSDPIEGNLAFGGETLLEGSQFTATTGGFSQLFEISYVHDGNNLALTAIPEPSTWALLSGLLAIGAAGWRRRKGK